MGADEIYRCLIENTDFVVYQIDAQGLISYVSPSIEIYSGYRVEEFIGRSFVQFIHPEDLEEVMTRFRDAAAGFPGSPNSGQYTKMAPYCGCMHPAGHRRACIRLA